MMGGNVDFTGNDFNYMRMNYSLFHINWIDLYHMVFYVPKRKFVCFTPETTY